LIQQEKNGNRMRERFLDQKILEKILHLSEDLPECGRYLTNTIKEITGANIVLLVRCEDTCDGKEHSIIGLFPDSNRKKIEETILPLIHERICPIKEQILMEPGEEPIGKVLEENGYGFSLSVPLLTGRKRVGSLIILGLDSRKKMEEVSLEISGLSDIISVVVRNSILYSEMDRKISERTKDLRQSEANLRKIIDTIPNYISVRDMEGRFLLANKPLANSLNISIESLIGMEIEELPLGNEQRETWRKQDKKVLSRSNPLFIDEEHFMDADGTIHILRTTKIPFQQVGSNEKGVLAVSVDITDKKVAEKKIIEERNRSDFYLDLLSHDIGNLHQGISSWLQLATITRVNDTTREKAVRTARGLVERSMKLVGNVLLLSKLKNMEKRFRPMDLISVIERSFGELSMLFPDKRIEIVFDRPKISPVIMAEPLIEELFFNLVQNAVKFSFQEVPLVEVRVEPDQESSRVQVSICDNGNGIPDKTKRIIFERFVKSGDKAHTGIGLSVVKELTRRYNGKVQVGDRIQGDYTQGACFRVTLPMEADNIWN
jgi:PAS domain S-box-containing protein